MEKEEMNSLSEHNTLCNLVQPLRSLVGRQVLFPISKEWFDFIHHNAVGDFSALIDKFYAVQGGDKCTDVCQFVQKCMLSGPSSEGFPAPMCCPFTKTCVSQLSNPCAEYFFTEKSDGFRVIFVSFLSPRFPRWSFQHNILSLPLLDVAVLEKALKELGARKRSETSEPLQLSFGPHFLQFAAGDDTKPEQLFLRSPTESAAPIPIFRRCVGRHFSYLFDRSMDAPYLLLDEYTFPSVSGVVLDGELLFTIPQEKEGPKCCIALFDMFGYTEMNQKNLCKPFPAGCLEDFVEMNRMTTSQRFESIQKIALGPMYEVCRRYPFGVKLFRKELWRLEDLPKCLELITKQDDGRYTYRATTYNDGIIFTPEAFDLISGARPNQLKWKFAEKLTIDWLVSPSELQGSYTLSMFFRKKRVPGPDFVGHTEYTRAAKMKNVQALLKEEKKFEGGIVAECSLAVDRQLWVVEKVRSDKSEANSVVTVTSVLESIAEGISSKDDLLTLLGMKPPQHVDRSISQVPPCHFILQAGNEKDNVVLRLKWMVRLFDVKNPQLCNHRRATECYSPDWSCPEEDPDSRLEEHLMIALANGGGSFAWSDTICCCFFNPERGRWCILSTESQAVKVKCYAVNVVKHLEACATRPANSIVIPEGVAFENEKATCAPIAPTDTHYRDRTRELRAGGERGGILLFNNWVKTVLITTTIELTGMGSSTLSVLDMCCGRGQDLHKWKRHQPRFLMMVDSCLEAVAEAAARYSTCAGLSTKIVKGKEGAPGIPAYFEVCDCFAVEPFMRALDNAKSRNNNELFHVVSIQFSIHYAFSSLMNVRAMLANVVSALCPGGYFIGTTIDSNAIRKWRIEKGDTFGNDLFRVSFLKRTDFPDAVGDPYNISIQQNVSDEVVEYMVDWEPFCALCRSEFKLNLIESQNFADFRNMFEFSPEHRSLLLQLGGKRGLDGEQVSILDGITQSEWEIAYLYRTFVFQKQ